MLIGIIEDHQLVRDSFKKLLELQPDWKVIIEACSVTEAKLAVELEHLIYLLLIYRLTGLKPAFLFCRTLKGLSRILKVLLPPCTTTNLM
ncbi:hypothetical protein [Pseudoalteromonas sp. NGC95]|uniref:hypothetical protein n=1 Tax=Pseudoalteromonas sp. NGC95 TaxID=2792051 RepID=UPI001E47D0EE|nr:hypothetical protein [Pseudoalteromonas sp. NGC95]